jgi:formylglycine-generating enzyme
VKVAGAVIFAPPDHRVSLDDYRQWWSYVPGANWRHPQGPTSDLHGRENSPVVDIAYEDAEAYANTFQGHFPDNDNGNDGYVGVAPVASFPANGYGLFDVAARFSSLSNIVRDTWLGPGARVK